MWHVHNAPFTLCVVISTFDPLGFPSSIPPPQRFIINPLIPNAMLPKKVLDLRQYPGLPLYIVFSDDDHFYKPYSSWDVINNSRKLVETNIYRRYDVVFSSLEVRKKCLYAIWQSNCVKAHCIIDTTSCEIHLFDVIEPDIFIDRCRTAPFTDKDYVLIIHEVSETYQIVSGVGIEEYGYLSDALTYDRR